MEQHGWGIPKPTESSFTKATIIRDQIPVMQEILHWSDYDVEFPPYAQRPALDEQAAPAKALLYQNDPLRSLVIDEIDWGNACPGGSDYWRVASSGPPAAARDGTYSDGDGYWLRYTIQSDHAGALNQPFGWTFRYSYIIPGGDYVDPALHCTMGECKDHQLKILTSSHVVLLNEDADFVMRAVDSINSSERGYNLYVMDAPFGDKGQTYLNLEFAILDPNRDGAESDFKVGLIHTTILDSYKDLVYFYADGPTGFTVFEPSYQSNYLPKNWPSGKKFLSTVAEEIDRVQEWAHMPVKSLAMLTEPSGPIDGVAPEYYDYLAAKLQENYPGGDYERILQESNIKQEWIDAFLDAMPQLG